MAKIWKKSELKKKYSEFILKKWEWTDYLYFHILSIRTNVEIYHSSGAYYQDFFYETPLNVSVIGEKFVFTFIRTSDNK